MHTDPHPPSTENCALCGESTLLPSGSTLCLKCLETARCPLWSTFAFVKPDDSGKTVASPRAGGLFRPDAHTEPKLASLTPEEKGDLSYGIYQHNRRYRLFERLWWLTGPYRNWSEDADTVAAYQPLDLDAKHLEFLLAQQPTTEERILGYMQELVRQQAQTRPNLIRLPANLGVMDLLQAASGCRECWGEDELQDFHAYAEKQGWIWRNPSGHIRVHLSGHMYVDEHTRRESLSQQGFIAMWFNEDVIRQIAPTIEKAIQDAGYTPLLIVRDLSTHSIPDQIVHQLRQSRFVVADLTSHFLGDGDELGRRNVYYESGFAAGADLEVIFTCRKNCYAPAKVASDIRHFNVVCWDDQDLESFRQELQARILARVRPGPARNPDQG